MIQSTLAMAGLTTAYDVVGMARSMNSCDKNTREKALMVSCFLIMFIVERCKRISCTRQSMADMFAAECIRLSGCRVSHSSRFMHKSKGRLIQSTLTEIFDILWRKKKEGLQRRIRDIIRN